MDNNKKEIQVRHHSTDIGLCREIWQVKPENDKTRWLQRDTEGGDWSYLSSGPKGYCEPEHRVPKNIDIVICNSDWIEYYRDGNNRDLYPDGFPTFEQACQKHWNTIRGQHLPTVGTPELAAWLEEVKTDDISNIDKLNWNYNYYHNIDPDNFMADGIRVNREDKGDFKTAFLLHFDYMGKRYHIVRYAQHHSMCNARWYMYSVVSLIDGKINGNLYWFGYGLISNT